MDFKHALLAIALFIVIALVGIALIKKIYLAKKKRKAKEANERIEKKAAEEKAEEKARHDANINSLIERYSKASFTKECAKAIFDNYQNELSYMIDCRLKMWSCNVRANSIHMSNHLLKDPYNYQILDYEQRGYESLHSMDELEAFAKAIIRNLPDGFMYDESSASKIGWRNVYIKHHIQLPTLKNIADS